MMQEDIDRLEQTLKQQERALPSEGFAERVMLEVRQETSLLSPAKTQEKYLLIIPKILLVGFVGVSLTILLLLIRYIEPIYPPFDQLLINTGPATIISAIVIWGAYLVVCWTMEKATV